MHSMSEELHARPADHLVPAEPDHLVTAEPAVFQIKPVFSSTPLFAAASDVSSYYTVPFKPFFRVEFLIWCRTHWWYYWLMPAVALFVFSTQVFFAFQTSYWWIPVYIVPTLFIILCELTSADQRVVHVLGRSFETWLVLINLLLMFVFSAIGKFYSSNPILLDGLSRADVQAVSVLNYLCTFLCGTFFLFFDAFQRSLWGWRVHLLCLLLLLAVLARLVILDQFVSPLIDVYGPICIIYCSDTRQLAMTCARNALIFTLKQTVKFAFGDGATAIVSLNLSYQYNIDQDSSSGPIDRFASAPVGACCSDTSSLSAMCGCVDNDQRLLNVQYAVYATGAPIIEEEKIDESQLQLPSFDVNLDPVMGVGPAVQIELQPPVSDSTSAQNSSSDAFVPPSIESSALPSGNHESASDAASASLSVARKIGYVPLVSALLPYRPLFCSIGFLNRVINSKLYRYGILAWGVLLVTAYGFQNSPIGPQNWYTFVPLVVITSGFIAFEIARVDRFLLYHLMRQFDFWFLVISLLGYIISEVYSQMSQPERCYNIQRGLAHTFEVFSSNFLFFWVYLSTFVFDAAVFVSNSTRIGMLILTLANTARLIIFDRLEGFMSPFCPIDIWYQDRILTDTRILCLGFLVTFSVFQCRYVYRRIVEPSAFSLLTIPIKIISVNPPALQLAPVSVQT